MANLAVKYRPKTFEDVVEQPLIVEILKNLCSCETLENRNFLLIGSAGVGKTTLARICADYLNNQEGSTIEIDAASHNGVDSMREVVQQARQYPVGCKYKVFIVDECFTGDTEILTRSGYKRFDELSLDDEVAQYSDDGGIEFVVPVRHIKRYHKGEIVKFYPKFGDRCVRMTPNHIQPIYNYYDNTFRSDSVANLEFRPGDRVVLSGRGTGFNDDLTFDDKLKIALSADGHILDKLVTTNQHKWQIRLSKKDKIDRLLHILHNCNYEWGRYRCEDGVSEFWCKTPNTFSKLLSDMFDLDMGFDRANQFIDEVMQWDGSYKSGYPAYYSSTIKSNSDFVSIVGTLAGYSSQVSMHSYLNPNYNDEYQVALIPCKFNRRFKPRKEYEDFEGYVYCVEVPTHKIFVRAGGFTMLSGNCHVLSQQAWQVLLKTLEEGPAKSIFFLCTTNPEKIPATIISRVQTFQLSKISLTGITNRLKYVLDCEIKEGRDIRYEEDAVNFIAKLASGGMRDALTLLDKALAYSNVISSDTIMKSLNLPNYDDYFSLLQAYAKRDNASIARLINDVYNSGVNFVKWFEGFHSFVMNVVKYIFMQDIEVTMIPSHYKDRISVYGTPHSITCLKLGNQLMKMNYDLKSTQYLQEVALTYLCRVPKKETK